MRIKKEEEQILLDFANKVKTLREEAGFSQEKLAELSDLHRTYIGSIERAEKIPSLITITRLSKALNINITQLLN